MSTYTHRSITIARPGFSGRRTKYRVAVATRPELLRVNGRSAAGRAAIASGDLRIVYLRGRECDAEREARGLGYRDA